VHKVATFEHHTTLKTFRFEHLAGFLIGYDGSWHLKCTAGNAYAAPRWGDVWAGKMQCKGGVDKMHVERADDDTDGGEGMRLRAGVMASKMVKARFWECKVDVKSK
jgi:hypothetical protein